MECLLFVLWFPSTKPALLFGFEEVLVRIESLAEPRYKYVSHAVPSQQLLTFLDSEIPRHTEQSPKNLVAKHANLESSEQSYPTMPISHATLGAEYLPLGAKP